MRFLLPLLALFSLSYATSLPIARAVPPSLPFKFTYLFTVDLDLNTTYPAKPIPIPGGVQVTEPIVHGTVAGPAANGTIVSGIATPAVHYNNTVQVPVIQAWGFMDDGVGFSINEVGTGKPMGQITRITFVIGGGEKYATLREGYVLTTVTPSEDRARVAVEGYLVENAVQKD